MKCASDYDNPDQKMMRQADDCTRAWWEGEGPDDAGTTAEQPDEESGLNVADWEAARRGLIKVDADGETCLACADEPMEKTP